MYIQASRSVAKSALGKHLDIQCERDGYVRKKPYSVLGKDFAVLALHRWKPGAYSPAVAQMAAWFGDRNNEYIDPLSEVY
jgi:hypothetical protein